MTNSVYMLAKLCEIEVKLLGVEVNDPPSWISSMSWETDIDNSSSNLKTPTSKSVNVARGQLDGRFFSGFDTLIKLISER